jgi:hypothetical protein
MTSPPIPGYTFGTPAVARAPFSHDTFATMQKTALFGDDDVRWLRASHPILADQTEAILDVWYGFVGSQPHLLQSFVSKADGKPDAGYLAAVRKRFGQWILDTARAEYDQTWLDYQHEIGLRHHRIKKNVVDGVAAAPIVELRHLLLLAIPMLTTLKPFLAKKGAASADVDAMHAAWTKSVLLQVTIWTHPYAKDGDW